MLAALPGVISAPAAAQAAHIDASIHAESAAPRPGTTTRIAIRMAPESGWHGYWSNPGDSGLPAEADWTLPNGVEVGALRHPAPALLELAGLASYVHKGAYTLLADLTLDDDIAPGAALPLRVDMSWLACSDTLCVPERASLALQLTAGDGSADSASASLFHAAEAALPQAGAAQADVARDGPDWRFTVTGVRDVTASSARLYPAEDGWFTASSPQHIARTDDGWQITVLHPPIPRRAPFAASLPMAAAAMPLPPVDPLRPSRWPMPRRPRRLRQTPPQRPPSRPLRSLYLPRRFHQPLATIPARYGWRSPVRYWAGCCSI
ncbi:thiol:disulfide interchange protein [Pacificimonas flava]|uniref:Thiol:disulfide interchange protein n=1 Tax=Pacificimonas flava TaxID=1234595 RepID=M2U1J3_9SPHN|nr:thiol:disulfide interchange protein [Pacificimonas flava]